MNSRSKFFLGHLLISFLIALCIVGVVFFIWYPSPLAKAVGVTHIFLMLIVIDVIVGPFLGLLVYKKGKKTLKFDLGIIVLIQLVALSFGIYSIFQGRPVWIAYNVSQFELVRNNEMMLDHIDQALPQYQLPSWFRPQYVGVEFAKDAKTRNDDLFAEAVGGLSLAQKPERYVDFSTVKLQIQQQAKMLDELKKFNDPHFVQEILIKYPQATAFLPLKATAVDMTILIDKKNGAVIKIVDLRPWK